jgi:hypothetical protein
MIRKYTLNHFMHTGPDDYGASVSEEGIQPITYGKDDYRSGATLQDGASICEEGIQPMTPLAYARPTVIGPDDYVI